MRLGANWVNLGVKGCEEHESPMCERSSLRHSRPSCHIAAHTPQRRPLTYPSAAQHSPLPTLHAPQPCSNG